MTNKSTSTGRAAMAKGKKDTRRRGNCEENTPKNSQVQKATLKKRKSGHKGGGTPPDKVPTITKGHSGGTQYQVPAKQYLKWQPITTSTTKTVNLIMNSNIREVLNLCSTRSHKEIQQHLDALKHRVVRKLDKVKAPVPKEEYSQLENTVCVLEESLSEAASHLQRMEAEMGCIEGLLEKGEQTEAELRRKLVVAETKLKQQEGAGLGNSGSMLQLPLVTSQYGGIPRSSGTDINRILIGRLHDS